MPPNSENKAEYSLRTRLFHSALAITICMQLLTSLLMSGPRREEPGDWLFQIHQYSGLLALCLATTFFFYVLTRSNGTDPGRLIPWFNHQRRTVLMTDIRAHWLQLRQRQLPRYSADSALASSVHGLGLLLMMAMAITGAVYFLGMYLDKQSTSIFSLDLDTHRLLASLVWVYLISHGGLAVLHHFYNQISLRNMWSLRR